MTDKKLETLLAELLKIPATKITDELTMQDVPRWDSLQHMELIASIEETFHIELTFDEIVEMTSVGQIKKVLAYKGVTH